MSFSGTLLLLLNVATSTDFLEAAFQQKLLAPIQQVEAGAHPECVHIVDTLHNMPVFRGFHSNLTVQPSPEPQQQATTMTTEIATASATAAATAVITTMTTVNRRAKTC